MKSVLLLAVLVLGPTGLLAATKPVPGSCTPQVNTALAGFVHDQGGNSEAEMDNVMVCGKAVSASFKQKASSTGTGAHQVTLLAVPTADGRTITVEIVTNDDLDGNVVAAAGDTVYAYGQGYITSARDFRRGGVHPVAGIHDTHCATNSHMDDGWVVVNGMQFPDHPCSIRRSRRRSR